jgi:putative protease
VPEGRVAVTVQHRIPTFHTEHCLYSHLLSEGRDFRTCGRPCERHEIAVEDHGRRRHEVIVDAGCRNTVFHAEAQSKAPWAARLVAGGVRRLRVEFVRESGERVARTLEAWQDLLAGRASAQEALARAGAEPHFGVTRGAARLLT